jgi:hypothetical protein
MARYKLYDYKQMKMLPVCFAGRGDWGRKRDTPPRHAPRANGQW